MDNQNENDHVVEKQNHCENLIENSTCPQVVLSFPKLLLTSTNGCHQNEKLRPVNLSWQGISYVVRRRIRRDCVSILKNVTGEAKAGELTAILGPSGAGKTTLLNILVGLIQKEINGKILVNDKERKMTTFRNLICFIQQQNENLPDLSLRETLTIAANLKLNRSIPREEKCKIVRESLEFWGLFDSKDTIVKKLSGGQRKRLSIAQEVINKPPVIFLDEPTSGLDSMSCVRCISLLKNLAHQGHNVICSIHQPTALIFEQFDRVCFLSEGECLYNGPRNDLLSFLSSCDLECPLHHNPADFVIEAALGEYGEEKARKLILSNSERYQTSLRSLPSECHSELDHSLSSKNKYGYNRNADGEDNACIDTLLDSFEEPNVSDGCPTNFCNQFLVLFGRATIGVTRSWVVSRILLSSHVAVAIGIGLLFYGIGNDAGKILDNVSCLFFCMIFVSFASTMGTVLTFPVEMPVVRREIFNRWYAVKAYYLARTLADIPLQIILPIVFGSIVYWMTGQINDLVRFVLFLCILIHATLISQTLGLCLGAACNIQVAVFMGPVALLLPPLLFCGYFIRLNIIPSYLRWLSYLSIFRYSFEGILLANYGFNRTSLECKREHCQFQNSDHFLEDLNIKDSLLYMDFCVLMSFLVILRIAAFVLLKWKTTKQS